MRILIADKFEQQGLNEFENRNFEVIFEPTTTADELPGRMKEVNPDVLVVRSTKVSGEAIRAGESLALVVRAGAGYNTIDIEAASMSGVFVANCPGRNALAVAELAWGLIICCDRRIPDQTRDLLAGTWNKKEYSKASGLAGRTIGVVGMGQIGQAVVDRARGFEMQVAAWSRSLRDEHAQSYGVTRCENIINLAKLSDVVSVHVAANEGTHHLINDKFIDAMREGAILINTSRSSVMDEAAVLRGIREKGIRVGLDVFDGEPGTGTGSFSNELMNEPGVYGTHHVGASTNQAQEAIAAETIRIISCHRDSGVVPNCVNQSEDRGSALLTVRHRNKPGVLAKVFDILSQASLNVEEMENLIYEGGESACARIQLGSTPSLTEVKAIESEETVLGVSIATLETIKG
ncbi:MAG: NAD(P)-binding domain-containing protein [Phycisphaerales bacterium]|nr:NAD(P)-binding domain-containing protein [Phycisphaerales bacterium]